MRDLQPMNLSTAARQLGLDPFEVVRLMVGAELPLDNLQFTTEMLSQLRQAGGIEESWWSAETELPKDHDPRRQRVRAALSLLMSRGHVGGEGTRVDNVSRGLERADVALINEALRSLAEDGLLELKSGKTGTCVTVAESGRERVEAIVDGNDNTSGLSALYEE